MRVCKSLFKLKMRACYLGTWSSLSSQLLSMKWLVADLRGVVVLGTTVALSGGR
jgi:hypothetical protein